MPLTDSTDKSIKEAKTIIKSKIFHPDAKYSLESAINFKMASSVKKVVKTCKNDDYLTLRAKLLYLIIIHHGLDYKKNFFVMMSWMKKLLGSLGTILKILVRSYLDKKHDHHDPKPNFVAIL